MLTERQAKTIEMEIELIANKGIQGFTVINLFEEIGVSEPAIYSHFESKMDILFNILKNFKVMSEKMSSLIAANLGTALDKIKFLYSKIIEVFTEQRSRISEVFNNKSVLKEQINRIQNIHQVNIENTIAKCQLDGNVRSDIDKNTLVLIFRGSLPLFVKRWDINNQSSSLKLEAKNLLRTI